MAEMIKQKQYSSLYNVLYNAGVVENMLKALVEYENFKEKQGNRPIAKNRSVDMSQVKESSAFTEGISDVIKSVMNKVKGVSLKKDIGQYILVAEKGAGDFYVKAYSKGNMHKPVGGVVFTSLDDGKTFYSDDTYVYNPHKRKGIATAMYNFAREHGLNIVPSSEQSPDGEKFTKSYFSNKNIKESTDYIQEK
jgi:predicted GNAT family acetyltransferase